MSEKLSHQKIEHSGESQNSPERKHEAPLPRHEHEKKESEHNSAEQLETIHKSIETHAQTKNELNKPLHDSEAKTPHHHGRVSKDIKDLTYERTLVRTRKKLRADEKVLSKIVHQPVIEKISETASKTIARPSGLFAGGLFAAFGTGIFLLIVRHHGYEYNYLVLLMLFVIGYFFGAIIEISLKLLRKNRS